MIGEQAYQNAMRRRAELRQELDEIEQFLQLCEKFAGPQEMAAHAHVVSGVTMGDSVEASVTRHSKIVSGMELVPHIRRAILDVGRPQSRSAVVKALSDRGIQVGGQDPVTNVGTIMWRAKDEFVNLKPHGYWPRDVAYAPANYDPERISNDEPDHEERKENGSASDSRAGASEDLWGSTTGAS